MKRMVLITVFLLRLVFSISAQEGNVQNLNFSQFYETELMHWSFSTMGGLSLNYGYSNWNYNPFNSSLNNEKIGSALLEFPDSAHALNSYGNNARTANALYWGGLVAMLGSIIFPVIAITDEDNFGIHMGLWGGFFVGGTITSIIGAFRFNRAQEDLFNAVNIFNRNKARELSGQNNIRNTPENRTDDLWW